MNMFNLYMFVHCIDLLVSISRMFLTLPNLSNVDPLLVDTTIGVINGFTSSTSPNVKQFGNTVNTPFAELPMGLKTCTTPVEKKHQWIYQHKKKKKKKRAGPFCP